MSKSWEYRLSTIPQNYDFRLTNQQQNASNFSHLMPTALLFDLGTVIIDIDPSLTVAAFRKLLGEHSDRLLAQTNWEEWHSQLEIGALSAEAFINRIQSASPVPLHFLVSMDSPDHHLSIRWMLKISRLISIRHPPSTLTQMPLKPIRCGIKIRRTAPGFRCLSPIRKA